MNPEVDNLICASFQDTYQQNLQMNGTSRGAIFTLFTGGGAGAMARVPWPALKDSFEYHSVSSPKVIYPIFSPFAASVPCNSCGGSL